MFNAGYVRRQWKKLPDAERERREAKDKNDVGRCFAPLAPPPAGDALLLAVGNVPGSVPSESNALAAVPPEAAGGGAIVASAAATQPSALVVRAINAVQHRSIDSNSEYQRTDDGTLIPLSMGGDGAAAPSDADVLSAARRWQTMVDYFASDRGVVPKKVPRLVAVPAGRAFAVELLLL